MVVRELDDIAIDAECNVYVTDHQGGGGSTINRIQKFSKDGTLVNSWGSPGANDGQFGPRTNGYRS